jgi:hypothetical protein
MSDLEIIKSKLRHWGFYPEFINKSKYFAKLKSYLGVKGANDLLDEIDLIISSTHNVDHIDTEFEIASLAKGDSDLLKIIYSTDIHTSAFIFNEMLNTLDNLEIEPKLICDLGGGNGWTLELLDEYFNLNSELFLIEKNENWGKISEGIKILSLDYNQVSTKLNSDLTISIFGVPFNQPQSLLKCASIVMKNESFLLLALRIPDNPSFANFQKYANLVGLGIIKEKSRRVKYINSQDKSVQIFPLLLISNSIEQSEILKLEDLKID